MLGVADLSVVRAVGLELAAVVAEVVAERVDRRAERVLREVEVAAREGARGVDASPRCSRRRCPTASTGLITLSMPTSFSHALMRARVSWRTCRVVVHSSILAFRPSFSTMPSPSESAQPPSARICLAFSGSKRRRGLVRVEPGRRADVRVRDLGVAAEEPRVDLVLVDRVGDGLADRRVGRRAARAAVLDRRVARAATGALVSSTRRTVRATSSGAGTRTGGPGWPRPGRRGPGPSGGRSPGGRTRRRSRCSGSPRSSRPDRRTT